MKPFIQKLGLLAAMLLTLFSASAGDYFCVDGIYYGIIDNTNHEVAVAYSQDMDGYSGEIVIPAVVSYKGVQYSQL